MADAGYTRIDSSNLWTAGLHNGNLDHLERIGTYAIGRGVLSGLTFSFSAGSRVLTVASGVACNGLRGVAVSAFTTTIPASVSRYVWLTPETGAISLTAASTDPGGTAFCLGYVTTDGTQITATTTAGRVDLGRWADLRTFKQGDNLVVLDLLNNRVGIGKVPASGVLDVGGDLVATQVKPNVLELPQVSTPSTPTDSIRVYSKDVSGKAELFYLNEDGTETQITSGGRPYGVRYLYKQQSVAGGDTVANTAAQTNFASKLSIPANTLRVGQVLTLEVYGTYGTDAVTAGTITLRIKFGSTVLVTSGALTNVVSLSNRGWMARAVLTVISLGATGTIEAQGYAALATAISTAAIADLENTAVVTVDTTATQDLQVSVEFSVADADNTITQRALTVLTSME